MTEDQMATNLREVQERAADSTRLGHEILCKAARRCRKGWTAGPLACDSSAKACFPESDEAVRWSAYGALRAEAVDLANNALPEEQGAVVQAVLYAEAWLNRAYGASIAPSRHKEQGILRAAILLAWEARGR